jgi:hypothetical protein
MKTVRQLADEIGVSKQAVWKKIRREPLSTGLRQLTTTSGRTVYINEQGELLVKTAFLQIVNEQPVDEVDAVDVNHDNQNDNHRQPVDDEILFLRGELESKNRLIESQSRQLENKDKQIGELTAAMENTTASLHAAQALHAGTMQKQLESGASNLQKEGVDDASHQEAEKKIGLFARIFSKK